MSSLISKSSCLETTVPVDSQAVLKLGEKLASQLGDEHSDDLLCRWMAYYLAEKMTVARASTGDDRVRLESETFDVILKLWANRNRYPNGMRPIEDFEPIVQLLSSLTQADGFARYFSSSRRSGRAGLAKSDAQAETWLNIADSVDDAARSVILYCLSAAVQNSTSDAEDWLELAKAVGLEKENELPVIRILIANSGIAKADAAEVAERERIEDLVRRLRGFERIAQVIVTELEKKLVGDASAGK